ncbi:MAG: TonB-dependent receptor [Pseudomonadota bacterium]
MQHSDAIIRLLDGTDHSSLAALWSNMRPAGLCLVALFILVSLVSTFPAAARDATDDAPARYEFNVAASNLGDAVATIAQQTGLMVLYPSEYADYPDIQDVKGSFTAGEALDALLRGSAFEAGVTESGLIYVSLADSASDQRPQQSAAVPQSAAPAVTPDEAIVEPASEQQYREEVLVTALRREANLQDVPVSIKSLSEAELDRQGLNTFLDFAEKVPALGFSDAGGPTFQTMSLRGVGPASQGAAGLASPSTVAVYMDETPVVSPFARNASIQPIVFDIERVEVLRGPQGTLFGASSMGGAIRYITNKPDPEGWDARVTSELAHTEGGSATYGVSAMGNVPISSSLAARFVATGRRDGGYIDRQVLPLGDPVKMEEDINETNTAGARVSLLWTPTERLAITPTFHYQKVEQSSAAITDLDLGDFLQARFEDAPQESRDEYYNLLLEYDLSWARLISSTTYLDREVQSEDYFGVQFANALGIPVEVVIANTDGDLNSLRINPNELFVQELRLQSDSDSRLSWSAGAFFQDQKGGEVQQILARSLVAFTKEIGLFPPDAQDFAFDEVTSEENEQLAVFGELTYRILDNLEASIGVRWTDTQTSTDAVASGVLVGSASLQRDKDHDTEFTPRYHLAWYPDDDLMVYGSAAKGFRIGRDLTPITSGPCVADLIELGINPSETDFVDGDSLWSYELGAKTQFFDRRLTVNMSAYYIDWDDIQQGIELDCGSGYVVNAGAAEIRGLEVDVTANPTDALTLSFAFSYIDSESGDSEFNLPEQEAGAPLPEVPEWTAAAGAEYRFPINGAVNGYVRADVSYRSEMFQDFAQTPEFTRPSYTLVGTRIGFVSRKWDVALYGNNLLDEYILNNIFQGGLQAAPARPRTWGIRASWSF